MKKKRRKEKKEKKRAYTHLHSALHADCLVGKLINDHPQPGLAHLVANQRLEHAVRVLAQWDAHAVGNEPIKSGHVGVHARVEELKQAVDVVANVLSLAWRVHPPRQAREHRKVAARDLARAPELGPQHLLHCRCREIREESGVTKPKTRKFDRGHTINGDD